eukprot:366402-Chlamydomonas_euryale.AAC.11
MLNLPARPPATCSSRLSKAGRATSAQQCRPQLRPPRLGIAERAAARGSFLACFAAGALERATPQTSPQRASRHAGRGRRGALLSGGVEADAAARDPHAAAADQVNAVPVTSREAATERTARRGGEVLMTAAATAWTTTAWTTSTSAAERVACCLGRRMRPREGVCAGAAGLASLSGGGGRARACWPLRGGPRAAHLACGAGARAMVWLAHPASLARDGCGGRASWRVVGQCTQSTAPRRGGAVLGRPGPSGLQDCRMARPKPRSGRAHVQMTRRWLCVPFL